MPLTNYTELQASIADWLNRTDQTEAIKDFIALAESRWQDRLRAREMLTRSTLAVTTQYTALPADFLEMKSVYIASPYPIKLEVLSKEQLDKKRADDCDTAGTPRFFAIVGSDLEVFPTPSVSATLDTVYYQEVPVLSAGNPTNWLLTKYPDLYLFGALISSAPFLNDDGRLEMWVNGHDARLEEINKAAEKAAHSGSLARQRYKAIG